MKEWLDKWTGVGHVVTGMQRQDYDLALTRYDTPFARDWHIPGIIVSRR